MTKKGEREKGEARGKQIHKLERRERVKAKEIKGRESKKYEDRDEEGEEKGEKTELEEGRGKTKWKEGGDGIRESGKESKGRR